MGTAVVLHVHFVLPVHIVLQGGTFASCAKQESFQSLENQNAKTVHLENIHHRVRLIRACFVRIITRLIHLHLPVTLMHCAAMLQIQQKNKKRNIALKMIAVIPAWNLPVPKISMFTIM
jgi:hypothetical protein